MDAQGNIDWQGIAACIAGIYALRLCWKEFRFRLAAIRKNRTNN